MKQLKNLLLATGLALTTAFSPANANADDILKGMKGPSDVQLQEKLNFSRNEKGLEAVTLNNTLIYWNGKERGIFGFVNVPYKSSSQKNNSSEV